MRIAIISDIHDQVWNLRAALTFLQSKTGEEAIQEMICCGDLCSPFVVDLLVKYFDRPIHIVFGNNDGDTARITEKASRSDQVRIHHEWAELVEVEGKLKSRPAEGQPVGKRIAVQHYDTIARPIAQAELYDVVCFGHNHTYEVTRYGRTLALNPGAILGYHPRAQDGFRDGASTFITYDMSTGLVQGYEIVETWRSETLPGKVKAM